MEQWLNISFFQTDSNGHTCPINYNPADHFVITLAIEPGREEQCREKVNVNITLSLKTLTISFNIYFFHLNYFSHTIMFQIRFNILSFLSDFFWLL